MLLAHKPLQDPAVVEELFKTLKTITPDQLELSSWSTEKHITQFTNWITQQNTVSIIGLKEFKHRAICSGTSAAIENFISRNHQRRIRFSQSEFVLSKIVCRNQNLNFSFLESDDLKVNDALVISLPFSGNGSVYPRMTEILEQCSEMDIPVLIDAAYIGIASFLTIDLRHKCITDFTTSLSKPFHTMLRHGIRFTREVYDDNIQGSSDMGVLPRINVVVAEHLMKVFNKDYIIQMYAEKNAEICKKLNLTPSSTITLALGNESDHPEFKRGDFIRVCITDELLS